MLKVHLECDLHGYESICNQNHGNAIDVLLQVSQSISLHLQQFNPTHLFELQKYYPEQFKAFWDNKRASIYNHVKDNLSQGINQNLYRKDLNVELITTLYTHHLQYFSVLNEDLFEKFKHEEIFKTVFENHIRAITNKQGLEYFEQKKIELQF